MSQSLKRHIPDALEILPHHISIDELRADPPKITQVNQRMVCIWKKGHPNIKHLSFDKIVSHIKATQDSVAVVRNPYDFLVSCFLRRGQHQSFLDFIETFAIEPFIKDGRIYHLAECCDHILRYESLQEDLNQFLKRRGLPPIQLNQVNVTPKKKPWRTYYSCSAIQAVNKRFGNEIQKHYALET